MSLAEMIQPPEGVECSRWRSKNGTKRCYYYVDGGACSLDTYFMCVEWMFKNHGFRNALEHRQQKEQIASLEALTAAARAKKSAPPKPNALAALQALVALTEGQK